jgi:hypothetical protein
MSFIKACKPLFLLLFLCSIKSYAQFTKGIQYTVEACNVASSGTYAPFWLSANKYGLSSIDKNYGWLRLALTREYQNDRNWEWSYGLDLASGYNMTSSFVIQQAYVRCKYQPFEVTLGSYEYPLEIKDATLSTGGMTHSTNARPIPQLRIAIPSYSRILRHNDWLFFRGHIAYGFYTDNNWQKDFVAPQSSYTQNTLYHSKSLFVKVGNKKHFPIVFEGGVEMVTQFGGEAFNVNGRADDPTGDYSHIKMNSGWKSFFRALFPSGADATDGGYDNAEGNHMGSWHAAFTFHLPTWKIHTYYEHFFEDHSMMLTEYTWKDGLYGIEVTLPKNRWIDKILYEYVGTKDQSGPIYHDATTDLPYQISAMDNYYNHMIYTGLQHWGMGMGNPLLLSPIYNTTKEIYFRSNRIIAHHLGFSGHIIPDFYYRILCTYTKSWGGYGTPYINPKEGFSALFDASYTPSFWKGWKIKASFAIDRGDLMHNNTGGMISISKTGWLTK